MKINTKKIEKLNELKKIGFDNGINLTLLNVEKKLFSYFLCMVMWVDILRGPGD